MPLPATCAAASAWKSTVPLAGVTYLTCTSGCVLFQRSTAGLVFAHDQNVRVTLSALEPALAASVLHAATIEIAARRATSRRPRDQVLDAGMDRPFTASAVGTVTCNLTRVTWRV